MVYLRVSNCLILRLVDKYNVSITRPTALLKLLKKRRANHSNSLPKDCLSLASLPRGWSFSSLHEEFLPLHFSLLKPLKP